MGTRSITRFYESPTSETPFATLYRQMDGYPTGHGDELADFLRPIEIVNGLSSNSGHVANGMGCLAAQVVAHFKDGPGSFYLQPHVEETDHFDYVYEVYPSRVRDGIGVGVPMLRARAGGEEEWLYDGPAVGFVGVRIDRS